MTYRIYTHAVHGLLNKTRAFISLFVMEDPLVNHLSLYVIYGSISCATSCIPSGIMFKPNLALQYLALLLDHRIDLRYHIRQKKTTINSPGPLHNTETQEPGHINQIGYRRMMNEISCRRYPLISFIMRRELTWTKMTLLISQFGSPGMEIVMGRVLCAGYITSLVMNDLTIALTVTVKLNGRVT